MWWSPTRFMCSLRGKCLCVQLYRQVRHAPRVPWVESASDTFVARHDARDADDVVRVLAQLEHARARLEERFETRPGELAVVLHPNATQLDAAQPWLPIARRLTAPAARRYVVGWAGARGLRGGAPPR